MTSLTPFRDAFFAPIESEFNRLFDRMFGPDSVASIRSRCRSGYPKLDVVETDQEYVVEVEVPGVNPDDLKVEIVPETDDKYTTTGQSNHMLALKGRKVLKISGKKDYDYQYPEGTTWHVKEMKRSQFTREILLPEHIVDDPAALYERGILRLVWTKQELPKAPEPKLIPITKK